MSDTAVISSPLPSLSQRDDGRGYALVFLSALMWSFGGTFARFVEAPDSWTVVFWRSFWAAVFLVGFLLRRDGLKGTLRAFATMGMPGLAVAVCFAISSASFVVALSYTTVANVLLIQAGVPLFAALIAWAVLGERISAATWAAIAAVIVGVGVMVSESLDGKISPVGDGLALLIMTTFAIATVITRRFAHVRMVPATCLGAALAGLIAATQASTLAVSVRDMSVLVGFGMINLGLGFAFFATGARLIPAAMAALLGTFEPLLGPVWVWLFHAEVPSPRTIIGGAIVFCALLTHIGLQMRRQRRAV
jgi:drug/metabolite transporter (DMT)-like permease